MGVLSCGLRKRTPSSVTCASCSRETIWKLCVRLSVPVICCEDAGSLDSVPSTVCVYSMSAKNEFMNGKLSNHLSKYYAAMTATCVHRQSHPVSFAQVSTPYTVASQSANGSHRSKTQKETETEMAVQATPQHHQKPFSSPNTHK
jgi:hypothetical protein